MSVLDDTAVRILMRNAWHDSLPGTDLAHEEGGFVLRDSSGNLSVERWPTGVQSEIFVPPHTGGKRDNLLVVATFHTHPNPGQDFQQEPSLTDIRAVRNDPDLRHPEFEGEFVISSEWVYLILKDGDVFPINKTLAVFEDT